MRVVLGVRVIETGRASLTTSPHSVAAMQVKMAQIGNIGTEATGLIAQGHDKADQSSISETFI
jgi:hypothetical protein